MRLLGSEPILTGVQPEATRTLVLLGVEFKQLKVCASLAGGLALLGVSSADA